MPVGVYLTQEERADIVEMLKTMKPRIIHEQLGVSLSVVHRIGRETRDKSLAKDGYKKCSNCLKIKALSEFRPRTKRLDSENPWRSKCKRCDSCLTDEPLKSPMRVEREDTRPFPQKSTKLAAIAECARVEPSYV